ncbi:MAG: type 4a pilus biogenesis protein PilO [Thermodesulfobacteriota bacterium]
MAIKLNLDTIMKQPLSRRIIILAAINIAIIGIYYWFLIGPTYDEIKGLREQNQSLQTKLNDSRVIAANIPRYRKEKEELEEKLKAAVAQLPNEKEIPDLIDSISRAGEKAGLKILIFRPVKEKNRGFYAEVPVNMSVEGSYESLYDFSAKVSSLPRIVNIENMSILSLGHKNKVPVLKANFVATTFRFIPGPQKGAKKK